MTEKSRILKFHTFHQHAGWTPGSQMHLKYTHYFGNESSEELLESYGVETNRDKKQLADALLRPKQCPNCSESNIPDSKFCSKCRMVLTYDTYYETIENEKKKDEKITSLEKKVEELQKVAMPSEILTQIDEFRHEMNELKKQITKEASMPIPQTTKATTKTATDSSDSDSEEQEDQQQKQQRRLIKAAGRAAFLVTTKRRKGRKGTTTSPISISNSN